MNLEELKRIAASVGERRGWDFSRVRSSRDPVPWDYEEVVRRYLRPVHRVLDVGTGGGERLLRLAACFGSGVGIDADPAMIATAIENTPPSAVSKVSFEVMRAESLIFPDESFDVVLTRHAPVSVGETARLLNPGGYFITQQVGARNTRNICAAFGCGPGGEAEYDQSQSVEALAQAFELQGCRPVARAEYDVGYRFLDVESLIYWLKAVPIPSGFDIQRHWREVGRILEACDTPVGIETNEHRELLVVQRV